MRPSATGADNARALFMPASSDFKGLPLQTSLKVHSEPKGLFPAVTNTPRFATSAPFQIPTKVNSGRCKHGCRGSAVRIAAGDLTAADLRPAIASHPSHRPFPEKTSAGTGCETGGALKGGRDDHDDNERHHRANPMGRPHLGGVAKKRRQYHRNRAAFDRSEGRARPWSMEADGQ